MSKINYDGVVEAVHFKPDGQLDWVRVYERRGVVFSDRVMLSREAFVKQLKAGKTYVVGERIPNLGGKFTVTQTVHLIQEDGKQVIVVGDTQAKVEELGGVPVI
jgi:hypothetical protein